MVVSSLMLCSIQPPAPGTGKREREAYLRRNHSCSILKRQGPTGRWPDSLSISSCAPSRVGNTWALRCAPMLRMPSEFSLDIQAPPPGLFDTLMT